MDLSLLGLVLFLLSWYRALWIPQAGCPSLQSGCCPFPASDRPWAG